ncbi:cytochrome c family protein [Microvirga sp. W0021]|uniref:Cytochrome c family protein n=1 Tax=Hohaiivirga grylli TaxID=3133970 RepID=A0ABV0BGK0_9HYPH
MVMEINKFLGALFGCLLVVVIIHLTGQFIFTSAPPAVAGYNLPTVAGEVVEDPNKPADIPLPTLLASADADKGKTIAKQCVSCHTFDKGGKNGIGPNLWGIVDRVPGSHEGFAYSKVVKEKGGKWTYEDIDHMINTPAKYLKGTKMTFAGLKNAKDRADVLAYLRTLSDNPVPFPEAPPAEGATEQK